MPRPCRSRLPFHATKRTLGFARRQHRHLLLLLPALAVAHLLLRRLRTPPKSLSSTTFAANVLRNPPFPAPTLVFRETQFNGLGAQLLRILDAFALASALRTPLCISEPRYWNYGCGPFRGWSCYFAPPSSLATCPPPSGCPELSSLSHAILPATHCAMISTPASADLAATVLAASAHGLRHRSAALARRLWSLNARTRVAVRAVLTLAHVPTNGGYIAVHVRRGDKRLEVPAVPLARYAEAVRLLAPSNDTAVFIASDDGAAVTTLAAKLAPRRVLFVNGAQGRRGHDQASMNRLFLKSNYHRVVVLLAEIEALAAASVFVGTFSSNLGRFVHVLRDRPVNTSVSLDDRWAPGVAWKTFGYPYCGSPDASRVYCHFTRWGR